MISQLDIDCANRTDLVRFLRQHGERLLPSGQDKRLTSNHSITIRDNRWYDHATGEGGYPISFAKMFYGLDFPDAVRFLLGEGTVIVRSAISAKPLIPKPFLLPKANANMNRVFAYLIHNRHLPRKIVAHFAHHKLLYEDAAHQNCVFVGRDEKGMPRHAHLRSTRRGETYCCTVSGSQPEHSFHWNGNSEKLFVFEAPIDLMSYIPLHLDGWQAHSYVALCGLSEKAMLHRLKVNSKLKRIIFCLDNDSAGQQATDRLQSIVKNYETAIDWPELKDWNEDLVKKPNE